jgi:hypothetical protein
MELAEYNIEHKENIYRIKSDGKWPPYMPVQV